MKIQTCVVFCVAWVAGRFLPQCAGNVYLRKNLRDMSSVELDLYFGAVKKLNSGVRPTRWDMYANMHQQQYPTIHSTPLFLAWHRMMLYAIERDLRVHEPNVTIPYWDWTVRSQTPRSDPVLSKALLGGNGHPRSRCVTDGAFKGFSVYYWHSGLKKSHCLTRRPNIFQRPFTSFNVIDRNYLDLTPIAKFAEAIEGVPHATVHNNIGGEFSGHASPGDPLFYSHHAFVDKLWFDWQNRHKPNYNDYHTDASQKLVPWNIPIQEVIDPVSSLCYKYPEDRFMYTKNPRIASFSSQKHSNASQSPSHDKDYFLNGPLPILGAIKVADPLPIGFLTNMGFDITKIREQERKDALLLAQIGPN
ncbi:hypothetical protein DSO57_1001075 [Entomophthora muscae]|uniref:Uncharacterized protein n=1 Tax=Entomophthora muscae TaxID=34485 RepID=A0ACC2RP22_9FUNG|nr:hypothetical protein DSO57_1001075 [Entomophthora muscae]